MRSVRYRAIVILAMSMGLLAQTSPVAAACRFTTGGVGLRLSVVVTTDPGSQLTVDWGDGQATTRPEERLGRLRVDHEYQAAGDYTLRITEIGAGGQGCSLGTEITVPYEGGRDAESQIILDGGDPPPRREITGGEGRPEPIPVIAPARGFGDMLRDLFRSLIGN